jgi:hypothetical protein
MRASFLAAWLVLVSIPYASADPPDFFVHAKSGTPKLIQVYFDCKNHLRFGDTGRFVEHGTITIKDAVQQRCGNANEPVKEIWYTSEPGFVGVDSVTQVFPGIIPHRFVIKVVVQ